MTATHTKPTPKVPVATKHRFVQQHTWFKSRDGKRSFVLVEKSGKFDDAGIYSTTQVTLLEHLLHAPIYLAIDEFWTMVDDGRLVEYIPNHKPASI